MTIDDVEDLNSLILVKIPTSKNKKSRSFHIVGEHYINIYRKYASFRPQHWNERRLFIKYDNGKCCKMVMGIHKIGNVTREVASFLKIPNWKSFTGHCMRRTGSTLLVDAGGDEAALKRFGGWSSAKVAQGYIEESKRNKNDTAYKILLSNLPEKETGLSNSRLETRQNTADAQEQESHLDASLKPNFIVPVVTSSPIGLPAPSTSNCSPPLCSTTSFDVNSALPSTGPKFQNLTSCTFTLNFYNK